MNRYLPFIFCLIILTSCKSYQIPKDSNSYSTNEPRKNAYVLNPELSKEYSILKEANIYKIVNDSLSPHVIKIKLLSMERKLTCGSGTIITILSIGQIPVFYPDLYLYHYEEYDEKVKTIKEYELTIITKVWFWNFLSSKKDFNIAAGQALSKKYHGK